MKSYLQKCTFLTVFLALSQTVNAATIELDFDLNDLPYQPRSAVFNTFEGTVQADRPLQITHLTPLNFLAGFDEASLGPLKSVELSIDYSLSGDAFVRELGESQGPIRTKATLSEQLVVFGGPPGQPTKLAIREEIASEQFDLDNDICLTGQTTEPFCTVVDSFVIAPNAPLTRTFTGNELDLFRGLHLFGMFFEKELTDVSSASDSFLTALRLDDPSFPGTQASAQLTIRYTTEDPSVVPLPGGLLFLLSCLGPLAVFRLCKRKTRTP